MELNRFKLPKGTNNFLIWALVAVIVLGFGKSSSILGLNYYNEQDNKGHSRSRKRYSGGKNSTLPAVKEGMIPFAGPMKFNNILGGNGLFILAVVALLLLCKDDKKPNSKKDKSRCEGD
jgi:hypothetical protein